MNSSARPLTRFDAFLTTLATPFRSSGASEVGEVYDGKSLKSWLPASQIHPLHVRM